LPAFFRPVALKKNRRQDADAMPADLLSSADRIPATAAKKKARGEAGLWGRKALGPMRGWPQNSFLSGSLEAALLQVKKESNKRDCL
jgi:hypothetical protein